MIKIFMDMKKNILTILLSLIAGGLAAYGIVSLKDRNNVVYSYSDNMSIPNYTDVKFEEGHFPDFTFAAENAVKAVVHVKVIVKETAQPSIFDFFFGYGGEMPQREMVGAGSGVIISSDGYIVTNNHVIEGADNIQVTLDNNKSYKAKLVGTDPATDIALLKIDAENLPVIPYGDSDELRLGEWVLAIGNPYNLRSTITAGIVSAKARSMPNYSGEFRIESFIQTDAAVNSGNSGGALVNTKGELVGINTAIASKTGSYAGYSFAVPVTIVRKVVADLKEFGQVQRAVLGITMQNLTDEYAKELGLNTAQGVYIYEVERGGAADMAGIKKGDVLVAINGSKIKNGAEVQEHVSKYRPGDEIEITTLRGDKEIRSTFKLQGKSTGRLYADNGSMNLFGAELAAASEDKLEKLGLEGGVEVKSISKGKLMDAGIKKGFIITYVNQYSVSDPKDINDIISKSRRSILIEGVYPDGKVYYYGIGI